MAQKEVSQSDTTEKVPNSHAEECQQISEKCDIVLKKIKNRPRTKRVKND